MREYSFTLNFISSPKVQGYSKFHLSIVFMDARKTFISPPHRVGFRNSFRLIRTLTFWRTNPAWLQHGPNPGINFIGTSCKFIVVFIVVRA